MASKPGIEQALTASAKESLSVLGSNLEIAIKRRRLKRADIASQAMVSIPTLRAVLRGDPKTSIGAYAAVLAIVGLEGDLKNVAHPQHDDVGQSLAVRELPKRIKTKEGRYDF